MKKTVRKLASVLLALALLVGVSGIVPAQAVMVAYEDFGDLPSTPWYVNYLTKAFKEGIFYGVSKSSFEPDRAISRGEAVTVLGRVHTALTQEVVPLAAEQPFEDVKITRYYARYVAWAKENGIASGVTETTFEPDRTVTQEELMVLFNSYITFAGLQDAYAPNDSLDLSQVSQWAQDAVRACSGLDIIQNAHWHPQKEAKRGECAAFFVRLFEKLEYPTADTETALQKYRYNAVEGQEDAGEGSETPYPAADYQVLDGLDYQIIEDYSTYTALIEKLGYYGSQESHTPSLTVTSDTFIDHNILAVEYQEKGDPQFNVELGQIAILFAEDGLADETETGVEGDPASDVETETAPSSTGNLSFLLSGNGGGSTADKIGYVFFLEVPKGFADPVVQPFVWTEDYVGIGSSHWD